MAIIFRDLLGVIEQQISRRKSVLLLGARQTGKTTLLSHLPSALSLTFIRPDTRLRYERNPSLLAAEIEALVVNPKERRRKTRAAASPLILLDEIQRIPAILDVVQDVIDRRLATFVLTGSSARKLRRGGVVNLLPGRVVALRLDSLSFGELSSQGRTLPSLEHLLLYGALPGIVEIKSPRDREIDLQSYVTTYLEEEVRAEALVRQIGPFARFLELAAAESGQIVNLSKLSQEIGVSHATIAAYYSILEDCLIAERIEPITSSPTRKKLTKSAKYLFFDLGVRRVAAREPNVLGPTNNGLLFEQFVGLELVKLCRVAEYSRGQRARLHFWRDPDGPEVDWIISTGKELIPIEVKWSDAPTQKDSRHLSVFLQEYAAARQGYVVCRTPRRFQLEKDIQAIPWQELASLFES